MAAIGFGAWTYLKPYLMEGSVIHYESYTVGRGDIATTKSFSATLSVGDSETLSNATGAESIKKLYVTGGQEVREGDLLMELSDGTVLEAGIDGVVNEIRYAEGDWLRRNAQLVEICDLENLQVSLKIDEYDIDKIAVGQKCTIIVVPVNRVIETELTHVSRLSSSSGRVAYYSATAELVAPEDVLPGMTASVSIPDTTVEDVLTLDMAALSFDKEGKPYVLRRNGDVYEEVPVETGLSDGMKVEIISGLSEGDEVWVEAGMEDLSFDFSLTEIYKKIFGVTVTINEERGTGSRGNRNNRGGMTMPEGMTLPEGMEMPEGMSSPEGMTMPEGMTLPEGMEMPEGITFPGSMASPESSQAPEATEAPEAAEAPAGTEAPAETAAPESTGTPGGFPGEMPEGGFSGGMPEGGFPGMPEGMEMPEGGVPGGGFPGGMGGSQQPNGGQQGNQPGATEEPEQQGSDGE